MTTTTQSAVLPAQPTAAGRGTRAARVLLTGLLGTLAGLAFGPVFGGVPGPSSFLLALTVTAGTATAVGLVTALWPRLSPSLAALGGSVAVIGAVALLVHPGAQAARGARQLLTFALPVAAEGPALATVAALTGWTTLAAVLLAAYGRRPLPAAAPPLAVLICALAVGASASALPDWYPVAMVALLAALLVTGTDRGAVGPLHLATAAALTALAVLAVAVLGPAAASPVTRRPVDARALVDAPVQPRAGVSPLQQYLALRNGTLSVELKGTTTRPVPRLRMVTLNSFDGTYWTVDADYRQAGTTLPSPPSGTAAVRSTIHEDVRITVPGPLSWLPTAGRPSWISVAGLGVDESTGDVTLRAGGPVPAGYRSTSVLAEPTEDQIRVADPVTRTGPGYGPGPEPGAALSSGPTGYALPPALRAFADRATADEPPGAARLLALYRAFAQDKEFHYDQAKEVRGGHGLYQLGRLLTEKRGTSEQYASAYAVLARYLGYDARVVMGFRPRYAKDGSFTVTGRDVDAWAEVNLDGLGWVTIDPSPRDNPIGSRQDAAPQPAAQRPADDPVDKAAKDPASAPPNAPVVDAPEAGDGGAAAGGPRGWLLAGVLVVVVLLLAVLVVPVAKSVRRYRRRRAVNPRAAALGAWRETVDRLRDAGLPARPGGTTAETVEAVRTAGGTALLSPLIELARLVDEAVYAPEEPARARSAAVWAASGQVLGRAYAGVALRRRLAGHFDPRTIR